MHYEGAAKFCQKKKQAAKMESITEPISKTFIMVMGYFYSFSGFSRSDQDLFTSAYYTGNQAVKQEASH